MFRNNWSGNTKRLFLLGGPLFRTYEPMAKSPLVVLINGDAHYLFKKMAIYKLQLRI